MSERTQKDVSVSLAQQDLVLSALERDQLAAEKKQHLPRRPLRGRELVLLWSLRIYVLFMVAVVAYQVWTGAR